MRLTGLQVTINLIVKCTNELTRWRSINGFNYWKKSHLHEVDVTMFASVSVCACAQFSSAQMKISLVTMYNFCILCQKEN